MKKAIRFRKNDIVQGNDIRTGNWIIGRVALKGQQTVGILDNTNREWVLNITETFKASRREFDEWTLETNMPSLVTEIPSVESETSSAANMAEDMVEGEEDTLRDNTDDAGHVDDEDDIQGDHSVLIKPDHTHYVTTKDVTTASGRASADGPLANIPLPS